MIRVRKEKLEKKGKLEQMVVLVLMVIKDKKENLAQQDLQINLLVLMVQDALQTNNESYQNVVNVTITPTQSNSHMLIIADGVVAGKDGSNANQRSTGTAQITRDTTQIGQTVSATASVSNFNQTVLDTNNHGGNAVTYRLRLKILIRIFKSMQEWVLMKTVVTIVVIQHRVMLLLQF